MRHGTVDIKSYNNISSKDFGLWIDAYNTSNIHSENANKSDVLKILNSSDIILCSNLKRSTESVRIFAKRASHINKLFNEVELPHSSWTMIKLKPSMWLIFFRILWFMGYSKNVESYDRAKKRAKLATKMLIELSNNSKSVTLMGHGLINRLIVKELLRCNYIKIKSTGNKNWSYSVLTR